MTFNQVNIHSPNNSTMPKAKIFEEQYPHLSRFVQEQGWIELGYDENTRSFVRAYDSGGTVFEGKSRYKSIDDALQNLEVKVKAYLEDLGI